MLPKVKTKVQKLEKYKGIIKESLFAEIKKLSKELKGLKIIHINSTPEGGGVAEILKSLVPLMKGAGLRVDWHTIPSKKDFFEITKKMHNALQGDIIVFSDSLKKGYLDYIKEVAKLTDGMKADVWILHDPQLAGLVDFLSSGIKISRIHIDSSGPDKVVWNFLKSFLMKFDKIIFSVEEFIGKGLNKAEVFPPAINPFSEKNIPMSRESAKSILKRFGVDPEKPLVAQISRFDLFKDPIGVIESYKISKKKIPDLQLILAGLFLADDDPEAVKIFKQVKKASGKDGGIFLFSDPEILGGLEVDKFVNACQTGADVILQKSIKEGFGLSITEAMWKAKPVVGGNVGGIKLQIKNKKNGFLVSSSAEAAEKILLILGNKRLGERLGLEAKRTVTENFLMPRLLYDYLKLIISLM